MELNRYNRWIEDIDMLSGELLKRHKNLFFQKSEKEFYTEIEDLKKDIKYYDDCELQIKLAKIVASFGDAHTSLAPIVRWILPFEFYWLSDGIYIIEALSEYEEMKYCKLISVNDIDINEIIEKLSLIISHENEWYLKSQLPKYLQAVDLLYGLEIIDEVDYVYINFEDIEGNIKTLRVKSFSVREASEEFKLITNNLSKYGNVPLYRKSPHKYYWFEYLESFRIVYFKYNACRNMEDKSVDEFGKELIDFINKSKVEKLVIDLRNNFGGNSTLLEPLINSLSKLEKLNQKGKLFVIIGRETFSSALLNTLSLKEKTNAIFLGEPTGGKPNCYGEVERFKLKNFGFAVSCSTKYYKAIEDDEISTFAPDINIKLSIEDYMNNRDLCLEYVKC